MITALVGGQFGSEGKGLLAGKLARDYEIHVRVGAANAGHTLYTTSYDPATGRPRTPDPEKHVMQQIPCAAYAYPDAILIVGAGALISPEIFEAEVEANRRWRKANGHKDLRLFVDECAHVICEEHKVREQELDLAAAIGSTSSLANEGIGVAQAARALRFNYCTAKEYFQGSYRDFRVVNTVAMLHKADSQDIPILLEGTQGTSLSNTTGFYPYVTSRNTSAMGLAADCGVARLDEVIMVCRCHPIRVAGNSGPFWHDSEEIAWDDIGVNPDTELTTVTKKVRRVATFSHGQVEYNARLNGATQIALTFADYVCARLAGDTARYTAESAKTWHALGPLIQGIEDRTKLPVRWVGTGPHSVIRRQSVCDT